MRGEWRLICMTHNLTKAVSKAVRSNCLKDRWEDCRNRPLSDDQMGVKRCLRRGGLQFLRHARADESPPSRSELEDPLAQPISRSDSHSPNKRTIVPRWPAGMRPTGGCMRPRLGCNATSLACPIYDHHPDDSVD